MSMPLPEKYVPPKHYPSYPIREIPNQINSKNPPIPNPIQPNVTNPPALSLKLPNIVAGSGEPPPVHIVQVRLERCPRHHLAEVFHGLLVCLSIMAIY